MIYLVVFSLILKLPLTTGLTHNYYVKKLAYAAGLESPKVVLFAGSNGLFSYRCESMATILALPCVNASLHAGLSIDVALMGLREYLKRGDIVLLPLEYDQYTQSRFRMVRNVETNNYVVTYQPKWLLLFSPERIVRALFSFDLEYLSSALTEMLLSSAGVERRYNMNTLTANGDMKGHTSMKGLEYREFISGLPQPVPDERFFTQHTFDGEREVAKFLSWARTNGITVIGMLPTIFDDTPVPPAVIDKLRRLFTDNNQRFLVVPGYAQYQRSCFYDTHYHLNEECQIRHSVSIAHQLQPFLKEILSAKSPT
ncbi:MAG TPA: hypothetical protein VEI46_04575 [Thermodesulfovibrionales bacterium]|nr:hypothetical protein [Thermodesulfovibrionales bacterium]